MSCGLGSPSAITSPRSTVSPSNTLSWRHFGISSSYFSLSSPVMIRRRLPFVSLPKLTVPDFSASIAGQTARDVASLRRLLRDARDNVANRHSRTVLEAHQRAGRQRVHGRNLGVREGNFLTLRIHEFHGRAHVLTTALLRIEHHGARQTRYLVNLRRHRHAVDEVLELQEARHFGHDRVGMRIPGRADLARSNHVTFFHVDHGAVRDLVALALAAEIIDHADFTRARHRNQVPLLMLHRLDVVEADEALVAHLNTARRRRSRRRATDVERTHRELRSWLTDRLRGDDTNRLTDADRTTT